MIQPTALRGKSTGVRLLALLALAVVVALLGGLSPGPAEAATTFTVNSTGDATDGNINGVCDTSSASGRQCTLRGAILEANGTPGADTINFNIGGTEPVKTIAPDSALPPITKAVTINGYSQPGSRANTLATGNDAVLKVELNGENTQTFPTESVIGLEIRASNSTIKGLVINRFSAEGVQIDGEDSDVSTTGNRVEGNFIGTTADGTDDLGNRDGGVSIRFASSNTVGGTLPRQRNVVSGNDHIGVLIFGDGASANRVQGNHIGTNAGATEPLGNNSFGVRVTYASNNTIGGAGSGAGNVISGNVAGGVLIDDEGFPAMTGNKVQGNFIGTNAGGTAELGNAGAGVRVDANATTVGGTDADDGTRDRVFKVRNTIAHNSGDGVTVGSGVGSSVLSNRIFSNGELGIDLNRDGVTENDPALKKDSDTGPNNLQNFPDVTSATQITTSPRTTTIRGTLDSTPNQNFTVQCFLTGTPDSTGHGEGRTFAAEDLSVSTDATGRGNFECRFDSLKSQVGAPVSATATNTATDDTSEFSENEVIAGR